MATRFRRSVLLPCVAVASLLAGLPDFTALERAVSKLFVTGEVSAPSPPVIWWPTDTRDVGRVSMDANATPRAPSRREYRGAIVPMYASFVTLQVLDIHSTLAAIDRGARETNPMMAGFVDRPAAFVALKAGTAAGVLYMTERVRRHSPLGAVLMMAAFNSAYATVVANNYRVVHRLPR